MTPPPRTYASDSSSRKSSHPTTSRTGARDRARLPGVVARPLAEPTRSRYGRLLLRPQPGDAAGDALSGGGVRPVRDGLRSLERRAPRATSGLRRRDVARVPGRRGRRAIPLARGGPRARAEAAGEAVGPDDDHGFGAIQLPFNVAMADAFTRRNQRSPGDDSEPVSTLELAHEAGLRGDERASIGQGRPRRRGAIPADIDATLAGETPAQRALKLRTERRGSPLRSSARATSITFARTSPPGRSTLSARRRSTRCSSSSARGEVRERTETRERNAGTR